MLFRSSDKYPEHDTKRQHPEREAKRDRKDNDSWAVGKLVHPEYVVPSTSNTTLAANADTEAGSCAGSSSKEGRDDISEMFLSLLGEQSLPSVYVTTSSQSRVSGVEDPHRGETSSMLQSVSIRHNDNNMMSILPAKLYPSEDISRLRVEEPGDSVQLGSGTNGGQGVPVTHESRQESPCSDDEGGVGGTTDDERVFENGGEAQGMIAPESAWDDIGSCRSGQSSLLSSKRGQQQEQVPIPSSNGRDGSAVDGTNEDIELFMMAKKFAMQGEIGM